MVAAPLTDGLATAALSAGSEWECPMPKVEIVSNENGPNLVMIDGKVAMALCRCGHSGHKPMCDGTHRTVSFRAEKAQLKVFE